MTPEQFEHFKQFFPKVEELLRQAAETYDDPEACQALKQVHADFSAQSKVFFQTVAEGNEYLETRTAAVMKALKESQKELEELSATLAKTTPPPTPAAPEPPVVAKPIDPAIGRSLRDRLVAMCDPQGTAVASIRQRHADLMHTVEDWAMGSIAGNSLLSGPSTHGGTPSDSTHVGTKPSSEFDLWATGAGAEPLAKPPAAALPEANPPAKKYGGVDSWINSGVTPTDPAIDDSRS